MDSCRSSKRKLHKIEAIVGFSPSPDGKKGWQWFLSPSDLFLFLFCLTLRAQAANFADFSLILWITLEIVQYGPKL